MELSKITTGVILLVVGVILFSALVYPTVSNVQKVTGDEISYTNSSLGSYRFIPTSDDIEMDFVKNGDTGIWEMSVNGESIAMNTTDNLGLFYSDVITVTKNASGSVLAIAYVGGESDNSQPKTITLSDGIATFVSNSVTIWTGAYTWAYVIDTNGQYVNHVGLNNTYVKSINDITCSGYYSTGDNDTYYIVKNGVVTLSEDFTASLTYDIELVDGTTDIYEVSNFTIVVGDESFTPFRFLAPDEVTGHATSGTYYTLFGVIPVLILASLVIVPVGLIASRAYFGRSD